MEDLREEFVRDYVFPMFRANALYEGIYLLGTSIARPLIAKRQIEIAEAVGADAVSHGSTGKGNDQVRFELTYYALKPDIRVIAPWREWGLTRAACCSITRAAIRSPCRRTKRERPIRWTPTSCTSRMRGGAGGPLGRAGGIDVPSVRLAGDTPNEPATVIIDFERGDPVAVDGEQLSPAALLDRLNRIAGAHGIGRVDLVENRFVGMKSRGVYETPGGTVLLAARRAVESLTLDRGAAHLKDELMPRYAELIYNGFWFSPERRALQALVDNTQTNVTGSARLKLYKGNVIVTGRRSPMSLYDQDIASSKRTRCTRSAGCRGVHQTECATPAGLRAGVADIFIRPPD